MIFNAQSKQEFSGPTPETYNSATLPNMDTDIYTCEQNKDPSVPFPLISAQFRK